MIQIQTILLDSLRLLKARKLFWIVMMVTGLVGVLYASIGFHETGFSVGFGLMSVDNPVVQADSELAKIFYLLLFTSFLNDWWFGFFALILALVASCSVFPELMREGCIDVMISKPMSRLKLFLTKYLGVLLFMAAPVLLLCSICFLSLGLRMDVWKPELFLAVPLLMFVFSLIYSVAVFSGVLWRSTLFSLISAVIFWSVCYLLHVTEFMTYTVVYTAPKQGVEMNLGTGPPDIYDEELEVSEQGARNYAMVRGVGVPFPKIRKSTLLLKRFVDFDEELGEFAGVGLVNLMIGIVPKGLETSAAADFEHRMSTRYILVSSIMFEVIVLSSAAWVFCRRDF